MKNFLGFLLLFTLITSVDSSYVYATDSINLYNKVIIVKGDNQYCPFEFINNNGEPDGFNVELFKALMTHAGLKYKLSLCDWAVAQDELVEGKIDMVLGMIHSPDRSKKYFFGIPHSVISYCAVTKKGVQSIIDFNDLKGKTVAVQTNDRAYELLKSGNLKCNIISVPLIIDGLKLVSSKKVDAFVSYDITALYYIQKSKLRSLSVNKLNLPTEYYSFAVNMGQEDLLKVLDENLYAMKLSGEYDKIYYKWFGVYEGAKPPISLKVIILLVLLTILVAIVILWFIKRKIRLATDELEHKNIESQRLILALEQARNRAIANDQQKSIFLANMSHEIRTPINAIVGFSKLLENEDNKEEVSNYCSIIETNANLLLTLVSDILDISRIESGILKIHKSIVRLSSICDNAFSATSFSALKSADVALEKQYKYDCLIMSDNSRLTQVVINFITNAMKFTAHGSISIITSHYGNDAEIAVVDTGIGISDGNINGVFDRFVKLNDFAQGTGLGLSISKSIVELLDGKIGADSTLGKGSKFWVRIPVYKEIEDINNNSSKR